jgi:hypothetical protein
MTEQLGPIKIDGAKGLWTLEEVQALLEGLGHTVEVETPLDRSAEAGPEAAQAP